MLARDLSNQGLHIHREAKDVRGIALALNNLGWLATIETDLAEAVRLHEESLSLRRSLGDARGVAFAQGNLAWPLIKFGEFTRANALIADSIDTLRALGDQQLLAFGLILLGELRIAEDRLEEASSALMEAMGHASDIGHKWDAIEAQTRLGAVQLELGDLDNALATAELCSQAASVEFRWVGARAIRLLANCKRALNRLDEANTLLAGATRRFAELGARGEVLECLVCAAALAAARQDWERVALSSGALNALRTQLGIVLPPMQLRHLEAADESARHAMDPLELARFRELGATLQWRDVVGHITTL